MPAVRSRRASPCRTQREKGDSIDPRSQVDNGVGSVLASDGCAHFSMSTGLAASTVTPGIPHRSYPARPGDSALRQHNLRDKHRQKHNEPAHPRDLSSHHVVGSFETKDGLLTLVTRPLPICGAAPPYSRPDFRTRRPPERLDPFRLPLSPPTVSVRACS